jgi:hypothetical protein
MAVCPTVQLILLTEPISVAVASPSSGSDVWILLQRHTTTFATTSDTLPSETGTKTDGDRIKMALDVVENSWEGSSASEVLHDNGSAVSTPCQGRSSGANARTEARIYDVKLDPGKLQLPSPSRTHTKYVRTASKQMPHGQGDSAHPATV